MSTCSDSICENTFETSHVRFIHENFSVLITTPLDHIQQNLLRKETCQNTAKFHTRIEPYTFAGFNHTQNVQISIVYRDYPSFKQSIICI